MLMRTPAIWLSKLKATELHKLAVLTGTPCSGTKTVQIQGIQKALASLPKAGDGDTIHKYRRQGELSLVSIDMGIRNLAYSHWTTQLEHHATGKHAQYARPVLKAWRKINISLATGGNDVDDAKAFGVPEKNEKDTKVVGSKESFEPVDYANRAYEFVKTMLAEHNPSHVLIERQRFRTGGNAAVLEWTIRVGVFEGMLYAVLRSLLAESNRANEVIVEPILPARVNRYWLEGSSHKATVDSKELAIKKTAREVKQMKIELVRTLLRDSDADKGNKMFEIDQDVAKLVLAFTNEQPRDGKKTNRTSRTSDERQAGFELSKMDDLADCFLQGLGWIQWQNNRLRLDVLKQKAFL